MTLILFLIFPFSFFIVSFYVVFSIPPNSLFSRLVREFTVLKQITTTQLRWQIGPRISWNRVSPSSGRQPNAVWRWRARRPHTHSALTDGVRSCPHDRTWPPSPRLLPVALFPWASSHGAPPGGALLVGLFSMGLFSGEAFLREAYSRHILGSGSHPRSSSLAGSFRTVSVHSTVSSHVKLWCHGRVDKI